MLTERVAHSSATVSPRQESFPSSDNSPENHRRLEKWEEIQSTVRDAQGGSNEAWEHLYSMLQPRVFRYILARLHNVEDAEDVTSQTFLKVIEGIDKYHEQPNVPFNAWLIRIAHNEVISLVRKTHPFVSNLGDKYEHLPGYTSIEEIDHFIDPFDWERVDTAVKNLPPAQRDVIDMRFRQDLNVAQTAQNTGKTENNVKVLQHNAIKRIQRQLSIQS